LLRQEKEQFIQRRLAEAALSQFAYAAIEPVRQMILTQRLDGELRNLRNLLVETCEIMEERFPEFGEWKAAGERAREEHFRQLAEVADGPLQTLLFALRKMKEYNFPDEDEEEPSVSRPPAKQVSMGTMGGSGVGLLAAKCLGMPIRHVGGNDLCPCGSGKN
jgi:hypothetical protein